MTSNRPYLIRAIYEWLVDNQFTPYLMIDAAVPYVQVPKEYIEDGKIVLNVAPLAIYRLVMDNSYIEFDARFSGKTHHIYVPIKAVLAIYAFENGRGMVFDDEEEGGEDDRDLGPPDGTPPRPKGPPKLKVVK